MFSWICPKCGKEVPPAYSECPDCAAKDLAAPEPAAAPTPAPPRSARPEPRRRAVPTWLVTLISAAALIGAGAALLLIRSAKTATSPPRPSATLETPSVPALSATQASALAKNVELTGFRLTEDAKQKAVLQFVAVNHSAGDLGEISAKVNLKAVSTQQSLQPVGTFVFRATLGPYESKELTVPLDTKLRVYELPDWQFLRAEIAGQ